MLAGPISRLRLFGGCSLKVGKVLNGFCRNRNPMSDMIAISNVNLTSEIAHACDSEVSIQGAENGGHVNRY